MLSEQALRKERLTGSADRLRRLSRAVARRRAGGSLSALLIAFFATACNDTASTPVPIGASALPPPSVKDEFLALARRIRASSNPYLGQGQIGAIEKRLSSGDIARPLHVDLLGMLSTELLRVGRTDEAIDRIEAALGLAKDDAALAHVRPMLQFLRATAYLRKAETENCVARHNAECCIFPLQGGAIHTERFPAEQARISFDECLQATPGEMGVRWLANIVAMALGDHPQGLAAADRIPSEAFASEYDIKRFVDIAPKLGLDTLANCGGSIVEDFDNDGLLDIVASSWIPEDPLTFHRNQGDGTFADRSAASGLDQQLGGLNCIGVDYDNDGDVDILVLRGAWLDLDGRMRNSLVRNNGDGTFTDVTHAAGLAEPARPTQAAAWGDFDHDGDLDLYVANESCVGLDLCQGVFPSQLFRNNGDGTFTNIAAQAGVTNDRYAKGVTAGDYDNDGWLDLYVSNFGDNRLYHNNGDGTFTDVAPAAGVTGPSGKSFVPWFFDYDNDGWLDLFVGAYDATINMIAMDYLGQATPASLPALYRNNGDGIFADVTEKAGLAHPYLPMGANFGDLDNDGWLDFYLGTGDPLYTSLMPNIMMRNDRGRRFQDVTQSGGFGHLQKGHGIAFADIDHDGDQDIFHVLGGAYRGDKYHNVLFLNPGHGNHFLVVELVGTESNRSAYGARIRVVIETPAGPREIHRAAGSVSSFGGSPRRQHIGLADATAIRSLSVFWPKSGRRQAFTNVPIDRRIRVTEGRPQLETLPYDPIRFD